MKALSAAAIAALLAATSPALHAQSINAAAGLVSSWTLAGIDDSGSAAERTRGRSPRGLLVLDSAGYVFEYFSQTGGEQTGSAGGSRQMLDNVGGFWGRYTVDESGGSIRFASEDGVSPAVRGLSFTRSFELDGDRLVLISGDEPQAQGNKRWIWQRVPTVEHLSPYYREVVGFWQHIDEGPLDPETGTIRNPRLRGPSVIVYTPGGFVGVHFPPVERIALDAGELSDDEAQAALRGYIGYFGALGVYPGEVTHNILSGISPTTGSILRRYAAIDGDILTVELQSFATRPAADDRPRSGTHVRLRRLSGADEMLPRQP